MSVNACGQEPGTLSHSSPRRADLARRLLSDGGEARDMIEKNLSLSIALYRVWVTLRSKTRRLFCGEPGVAKSANLPRCESARGVGAPLSCSSPVFRPRPRSRGWLCQVTAQDRRAKGYADPLSRPEELEVSAPYAATPYARKPRPSEPGLPSVPGP